MAVGEVVGVGPAVATAAGVVAGEDGDAVMPGVQAEAASARTNTAPMLLIDTTDAMTGEM